MKKTVFKNPLLGQYTVAELDCGLKVYVMEKPGFNSCYALYGTKYGSIDTRFSRNGGEEIEVPAGIAHFLEHKLFESEDGDAFSRFSETGAYCNAYTSFDKTCYIFSCSKNFDQNLDILLDFVQSPYFTAETVQKEQGIIGQEIRMYEDNPGWRVFFNLLGQMFENHPVKLDIAGTVESIAQIDDKLLYECYNTFYNPSNMFVCIAGNVNAQKVIDRVNDSIKPCERVTVSRARFHETAEVKSHYVEQELEVAKPLFCFGYKHAIEQNPTVRERTVAGITLEILCGDCSPLYRRLIDSKVIGDEFSAEYFQGEGYAAFIIEGESDTPDTVAEEIKAEVSRLISTGIDERLLTAVKRSAYGDAVKRFDSTDAIATDMMDCALSGGELFDTADILRDIKADDVIDCLKLLREESSVLSVVRGKKKGR